MQEHLTTKRCSKCGESRPLDSFHALRRKPGGEPYFQSHCKSCVREACRIYHLSPAGRKSSRRRRLRRVFGISPETYDAMLAAQGGVCAICERAETKRHPVNKAATQPLAIDHDKATGMVRAILCDACNKGIGFFRENPELLRKAAGYLESFQD